MPEPVRPRPLRVAFLVYRGNPRCGGQGVYTRHLTRELAALGHRVTVFSGPPYPELEKPVALVKVPSLDLYREPDPFRVPKLGEFTSPIDALEFGLMCTGGFPEPLTFSLRARRLLTGRRSDFDVVHDNQGLGRGLAGMIKDGWPVLATIHHPITVDRELDLAHAEGWRRRLTLRRWYGFVGMQMRVARRVHRVVTVSESSRLDISAQFGVALERIVVVPVGVDRAVFRPLPAVRRVPGRIMATASSDVPMKGLVPLLEALAKLRTERHDAHLVVVGRLREGSSVPAVLERLELSGAVSVVSGLSDQEVAELYAKAEVAVVPSLYEGFSLPAIEAMACGVPLVATTGGALPEVAGPSGVASLLVPPGDPGALAQAIATALSDESLRLRLAAAGLRRIAERYSWPIAARATAEQYFELLGRGDATAVGPASRRPPSAWAGSEAAGRAVVSSHRTSC